MGLVNVVDGDPTRVTPADFLAEQRLEIPTDDKHHAREPGAHRVEHRVVEDRFTGRTHGIDLFQPART